MFQNIGFTKKKRKIADIREFREGADNFPKFSNFLKLLANAEVLSPFPKIGPLQCVTIC